MRARTRAGATATAGGINVVDVAAAAAADGAAAALAPFHGPAADSHIGERLLDVLPLVAALGFAADVSHCRELCRLTRTIVQRGDTADMLEQSLRLQCGARAARAAAREAFVIFIEHDEDGRPFPAEEVERIVVQGTTQLIRAASLNNLPRALQLIQLGAPLDLFVSDPSDNFNWRRSALHFACDEGNEHIARALLDGKFEGGRGAAVDCRGGTTLETPLMFACFKGHESIVRLLLARGARQELTSTRGHTAMHAAASVGAAGCLSLLCAAPGAAAALRHEDKEGKTPLLLASSAGIEGAVRVLLEHGAPLDVQDQEGKTAFHVAVHFLDVLALLCAAPGSVAAAAKRTFVGRMTPLELAGAMGLAAAEDLLRTTAGPGPGPGPGRGARRRV